jgi:hypothetical protein
MKKVTTGMIQILLARSNGKLDASQLLPPHLEEELSVGTLRGNTHTLPMHNSQFDLRAGMWSGEPI